MRCLQQALVEGGHGHLRLLSEIEAIVHWRHLRGCQVDRFSTYEVVQRGRIDERQCISIRKVRQRRRRRPVLTSRHVLAELDVGLLVALDDEPDPGRPVHLEDRFLDGLRHHHGRGLWLAHHGFLHVSGVEHRLLHGFAAEHILAELVLVGRLLTVTRRCWFPWHRNKSLRHGRHLGLVHLCGERRLEQGWFRHCLRSHEGLCLLSPL